MTLVRYLMEDGAQGATATNANTGASLVLLNSGTITFDTAMARNGHGLNYTSNSAGACETRFNASTSNTTIAFRGWFFSPTVTPSVTVGICNLWGTSAVAARLQWTATNSLVLVPVSGSTLTIATGLSQATQYDISILLTVGTPGSITGTLRAVSGTQIGTVSSATFNSNTTPIVLASTGIIGTYATSYNMGWDEVSLDDGSTTEIPRYSPPSGSLGLVDLVWTGSSWR